LIVSVGVEWSVGCECYIGGEHGIIYVECYAVAGAPWGKPPEFLSVSWVPMWEEMMVGDNACELSIHLTSMFALGDHHRSGSFRFV
jgi:hypothetical protein